MDSDAASQYSSPSRRRKGRDAAWTTTLAYCLLYGARAVLLIRGPGFALFVLDEVNLQLESRVREIRQHGSEGGSRNNRLSLPLYFFFCPLPFTIYASSLLSTPSPNFRLETRDSKLGGRSGGITMHHPRQQHEQDAEGDQGDDLGRGADAGEETLRLQNPNAQENPFGQE